MRLESFYADSMSDALAQIQQKLGPDAVIYSHKKTAKGLLEVVAGVAMQEHGKSEPQPEPVVAASAPPPPPIQTPAIEEDSPLSMLSRIAEIDQRSLQAELIRIEKINLFQQKLRKLKFPADFIEEYSQTYAAACEKEAILSNEVIIKIFRANIPILEKSVIDTHKICALIGPTGIGKSTSIAKLAKSFAAKYGPRKLGIISTDFQRIITKNQFHYFGRLLDIDIAYAKNARELKEAIHVFSDKQLTLIDTAGVSPNDNKKLAELLEGPCSETDKVATFIVLPCNLQSDILNQVVEQFRMPNTKGCIMTKKDEALSIAPCLSVVLRHQLPIAYWSDGQNISTDIHIPTKVEIINAVFQGERSDRSKAVPV